VIGRHPEVRRLRRISKDESALWPWFETAQERLLTMTGSFVAM
jgi:hypothetical protein